MFMRTIPSVNYKILEKEIYTSHTIARLTLFTRAFCHACVENLKCLMLVSLRNRKAILLLLLLLSSSSFKSGSI